MQEDLVSHCGHGMVHAAQLMVIVINSQGTY